MSKDCPSIIGRNLRVARETKALRAKDAAAHLGISAAYLSQIETGKRTPSPAFIAQAGVYYGVGPAYLLGMDYPPTLTLAALLHHSGAFSESDMETLWNLLARIATAAKVDVARFLKAFGYEQTHESEPQSKRKPADHCHKGFPDS